MQVNIELKEKEKKVVKKNPNLNLKFRRKIIKIFKNKR